jgi:2-polyprenyl-6-methoxyphenol hydroxylase-like FAD-dependent oxidoreductase
MTIYDVVIVGARCAGSPLAVMLARKNMSVCLVDKATFPSETPSTSAFQSNGIDVLRRLGILDTVLAAGPYTIENATVTSTASGFAVSLDPAEYGQSLGMRRYTMDEILVEAAIEAGADVRTGCAVEDVIIESGEVVGVRTRDGDIRARLVVGADGRHSTVAKRVAAREYCTRRAGRLPTWAFYKGVDTDSGFFYGTVGRGPGRGSSAYLGLPLDDCFLVSVNVPMDDAQDFLADRYANFDTELERFPQLADAVKNAERVGPIRMLQRWHSYFRVSAGPGWVLVGDAGNFKDYSLGQGQSDAFRQAEQLADRIVRGFQRGNVGTEIRRWWRWRDRDAWQMYLANCFLGEPHLPNALPDALFRLASRDTNSAVRFAGVFNKTVPPLRVLTVWQLMSLAPTTVSAIATEARQDRLVGLRALADFGWFAAMLAIQHPLSPIGAWRYVRRWS